MAQIVNLTLFLSIVCVLGSIPNLDNLSQVYISPSSSSFMQITSNPSTGYSWIIVPLNSDRFKIDDLDGDYYPPSYSIAGAPGYQIFRVDCNELCKDGDSIILVLEYRRTWEADAVVLKEVTLIVSSDPRIQ